MPSYVSVAGLDEPLRAEQTRDEVVSLIESSSAPWVELTAAGGQTVTVRRDAIVLIQDRPADAA